MPLFRKSLDQIKGMFAQMTFSQQAVMVLLALVVVGCVVWMVRFSGAPEMVAVLDQQYDSADVGRMVAELKAAGFVTEVKDGKVLVASADRDGARARLAANDALPRDFSLGFEQVVKDSNIWRSETEKDRMWKVAVENELAAVLKRFPGVRDAHVIIDRSEKSGLGRGAAGAVGSAAVDVRMKPGSAINRKLVTAVADWVSGAVRDLPRERVKVIDSSSGQSYRVAAEEAAVPADMLDLIKLHEDHLTESIARAIGIERVLIAVSVKVDSAGRQETATTVDKSNVVSVPISERSSKTSSGEGTRTAEPGVVSNAGATVANAAASAGAHRSDAEDETRYEVRIGDRKTVTMQSPGSLKEVSASVNVPRSYFVAALKAENGVKEPDAAALKEFIPAEIAKIKPKVLAAIGLTDKALEDRVAVGWYYDTPITATVPEEKPPELTSAAVWEHARGVGLGALAVASLVMMLLMMRKAASSAGAVLLTGGPAALPSMERLAYGGPGGRDAGGAGAVAADDYLPDIEVDQNTLRTQKMVEQVATMVKQDPDAAANLIRRWVARKTK